MPGEKEEREGGSRHRTVELFIAFALLQHPRYPHMTCGGIFTCETLVSALKLHALVHSALSTQDFSKYLNYNERVTESNECSVRGLGPVY